MGSFSRRLETSQKLMECLFLQIGILRGLHHSSKLTLTVQRLGDTSQLHRCFCQYSCWRSRQSSYANTTASAMSQPAINTHHIIGSIQLCRQTADPLLSNTLWINSVMGVQQRMLLASKTCTISLIRITWILINGNDIDM